MKSLAKISDLINQLTVDIRAEVLAASLFDEGLSESDIVVFPRSTFKRRYSRDVLESNVVKLSDYFTALGLYLSRDGIYDTLPEGLFHKYATEPLRTGSEMAGESKRQRREENDARKFFLPIENEMFFQRTQLEIEERKILDKISRSLFEDFFIRFWKIDRTLPLELVHRMIILLPFASRIAGKTDLTAKCLEAILQEEVSAEALYGPVFIPANAGEGNGASLGNGTLGDRLVLGDSFSEMSRKVRFRIGPLVNSTIDEYLDEGSRARFMRSFFEFFIPVELECDFLVEMSETGFFRLNREEEIPVLGYNTRI